MNAAGSEVVRLRIRWVREGTERLSATVAGWSDASASAPSRLPGWTRAHVLAHVALNASALGNLVTWARTGVPMPMYTSDEARDQAIESVHRMSPDGLRLELERTAAALDRAMDDLPESSWDAMVRTARGRAVPASEIPWIRARELWVHLVDLDAGEDFGVVPPEFGRSLLDEVAGMLGSAMASGGLLLETAVAGAPIHLAIGPAPETFRLTAPPADLLGWLTGRYVSPELVAASGGPLPELPPWM